MVRQQIQSLEVKGALNLTEKEAANIQDTFANFIVERLNYRDISQAIS